MANLPLVTRRFEIDAGHRLQGHEGKCCNVHGHRYVFEVTFALTPFEELDSVGRVVDFDKIKKMVGSWLDNQWDHGFIVEVSDPLLRWLAENKQKHYVLNGPPTIENMVQHLGRIITLLIASDKSVKGRIYPSKIKGYETPNCFAEFYPARDGGSDV